MSAVDALVKVETVVAKKLIQKIINQSLAVQMKIFGSNEVHVVYIRPTSRKRHFELLFKGKPFKEKKILTFKIEIATRLFFFKTESIATTKMTIIPENLEVFELARRREPRFKIPTDWDQMAVVTRLTGNEVKFLAKIRDISSSGMKLAMASSLDELQEDEMIQIQFKINKSPQITLKASVRHIHPNVKGGPTVGLHLRETSENQRMQIRKICDDIGFYIAQLNDSIF